MQLLHETCCTAIGSASAADPVCYGRCLSNTLVLPCHLNQPPAAITSDPTGAADLVCYGRHYIANPDLPRRFRLGAPLNK